ncbi:MAG: hypothetical protein II471_10060, partial [Bacteroidales bacterium]|nr:hypothetical protein [Bacteroidales bacterium]
FLMADMIIIMSVSLEKLFFGHVLMPMIIILQLYISVIFILQYHLGMKILDMGRRFVAFAIKGV